MGSWMIATFQKKKKINNTDSHHRNFFSLGYILPKREILKIRLSSNPQLCNDQMNGCRFFFLKIPPSIESQLQLEFKLTSHFNQIVRTTTHTGDGQIL